MQDDQADVSDQCTHPVPCVDGGHETERECSVARCPGDTVEHEHHPEQLEAGGGDRHAPVGLVNVGLEKGEVVTCRTKKVLRALREFVEAGGELTALLTQLATWPRCFKIRYESTGSARASSPCDACGNR